MLVYALSTKFNVISRSLNDWLEKIENAQLVRNGLYTDVPDIMQTLLGLVNNNIELYIFKDRHMYRFSRDSYHNCYLVYSRLNEENKMFVPEQTYTIKDSSS